MGAVARCCLSRSTAARRKPARIAAVLLAAVAVVAACGRAAGAGEWGPWQAGENFPALLSAGEEDRPDRRAAVRDADGTAASPLIVLVRVYQAWLSPVYGGNCRMFPTCSRYAIDAIRKHGPALGAVMATGRLMHEADEWRLAAIRVSRDGYRFFDPVENNDFWFASR